MSALFFCASIFLWRSLGWVGLRMGGCWGARRRWRLKGPACGAGAAPAGGAVSVPAYVRVLSHRPWAIHGPLTAPPAGAAPGAPSFTLRLRRTWRGKGKSTCPCCRSDVCGDGSDEFTSKAHTFRFIWQRRICSFLLPSPARLKRSGTSTRPAPAPEGTGPAP